MSCKPESQKQRLERIAVQIMAGMLVADGYVILPKGTTEGRAIEAARELIKQLDALPIDE